MCSYTVHLAEMPESRHKRRRPKLKQQSQLLSAPVRLQHGGVQCERAASSRLACSLIGSCLPFNAAVPPVQRGHEATCRQLLSAMSGSADPHRNPSVAGSDVVNTHTSSTKEVTLSKTGTYLSTACC